MTVLTPADLLARALANDPAGPLFTQYDDRTGERVELSTATLHNWVAKTANLLQESGVEPGADAAVLLPAHWQTAAIMLGCWTAGVAIAHGVRGAAPAAAAVAFAEQARLAEAEKYGVDVYALSLAPMAAPLRTVPAGVLDYATEVRGQGDRFAPWQPVTGGAPALTGELGGRPPISQHELVTHAADRAAELGLTAGGRLLVLAGDDHRPRPLDWLLAPLAVGASVVLLRNPDPSTVDDRAAAERVTHRLP